MLHRQPGYLIGYVLGVDTGGSKEKEFRPLTYCRQEDEHGAPQWRWVTGARAKCLADAEGSRSIADRNFKEVDDRYRRQSEWVRLLTAAHDIHVKERAAPAKAAAEMMMVVNEARETLKQSPRIVRWGGRSR